MSEFEPYRSVPRVSRLEYLVDFLTAFSKGANRAELESKLIERKSWFEDEKYKAVGRGKPFGNKALAHASSLLTDSFALSRQLGFIQGKEGDRKLTEEGQRFLSVSDYISCPNLFAQRFVRTYSSAQDLMLLLDKAPNHQITLSTQTYKKEGRHFTEIAKPLGLHTDVVTFIITREILSQLSLINWKPTYEHGSECIVYLSSNIEKTDNPNEPVGGLTFKNNGTLYSATIRSEPYDVIRDTLWSEYMELTDYVPLFPVFYSDLRSAVCCKLRISDKVFDAFAELFVSGNDTKLDVVWSSGSLPYSRDSANLLKSLPPKSVDGEYIIYLKIEKKENGN